MSLRADIIALFPGAKEQNGYIRIKCPYHKNGQEAHPSLSILLEDKGKLKAGYAKCFTCDWTGTFKEIAEDKGFEYLSDTEEEKIEIQTIIQLERPVYKEEVPYNFSKYLQSRGIDEETQKKFKVFEKEDEKRVYMPVFARDGRFLFASSRSTDIKRFFIPTNAVKKLAGIELVDMTRPIAICESQIDAMTFYASGFCRGVATLGTTGTGTLREIEKAAGPFFIAFDSDEPGNKAAATTIAMLGAYRCTRIDFGEYKDANNLWQKVGFNSEQFIGYIEGHLARSI